MKAMVNTKRTLRKSFLAFVVLLPMRLLSSLCGQRPTFLSLPIRLRQRYLSTPAAVSTIPVQEQKPSDSWLRIVFPFKTDSDLRDEYVNMYGDLRMGLLFESMDAMAGTN